MNPPEIALVAVLCFAGGLLVAALCAAVVVLILAARTRAEIAERKADMWRKVAAVATVAGWWFGQSSAKTAHDESWDYANNRPLTPDDE